MGEAADIAAEADRLYLRAKRSGAAVDPATVGEVCATLALIRRLALLVEPGPRPIELLVGAMAGASEEASLGDIGVTEFPSPRRVGAGDGVEKGILTAGRLRSILDGVDDDIMVTVHLDGMDRHIQVVDRPLRDPSNALPCLPDGPQTVVLNVGAFFDTRDY